MHTHILGICGTFMGGLAVLASELKHKVTGSDQNVYPPMSTQLNALGIQLIQGYEADQLSLNPDMIIVGNVMRRGLPVIEAVLNQKQRLISGPEWLAREVLRDKIVLAVSGTHGKTTTTSLLAWILDYAGLNPGFLIGGVPQNFGISARLGGGKYFVVEADEYDSAFFDKRSKFIHYRPDVLIMNNIEFDHADIFPDIHAIHTQFHHLIRTVPSQGLIVAPNFDANVIIVLDKGCWTPVDALTQDKTGWWTESLAADHHRFSVHYQETYFGEVNGCLIGKHNLWNALAAIAAARKVGINPTLAIEAINRFKGVQRRLELKATVNQINLYDDFAHHPTAIATTLNGLKARAGQGKGIIAAIELRSNSLKQGFHQTEMARAFQEADKVYLFKDKTIDWDVEKLFGAINKPGGVFSDIKLLVEALSHQVEKGDEVVFMSNGGFGGIINIFQQKLLSLQTAGI